MTGHAKGDPHRSCHDPSIDGLAFDRAGRLFVAGFDHEAEGNPGARLRFDGVSDRPLPARGQPGALFVPPSPALARPIGVLVLE
jgi:hypothetical protein